MSVLIIQCPLCQHSYQTLVMEGTKMPQQWHCSKCGENQAKPVQTLAKTHPLEQSHGSGCLCCAGNTIVADSL